jgi:F-type H+-transporting ATPase subunit b
VKNILAIVTISLGLVGGVAAQNASHPSKTSQAGAPKGLEQELAHESKEAAEGDEHAQFKHSPTVRWVAQKLGISEQAEFWVLYSIDFLIIALAIAWFWKSNIPAAFRARTATIRKTMDEARAASADANRRLSEIEGRLSKLDQEIAQMRVSAEAEAAAEEQRIRAAAEEDSRKIVAAAQAEVESSGRLARRELKAYAAELAVTLAEQRMKVDADTDRALVQKFSRELTSTDGRESR